ncbi:Heat shock protein Hsp20 domain containing protein [Dirofilaria immitis]|nr:Heat shock protein Hsp20 domain containing protein [Dirofilaria immitis]
MLKIRKRAIWRSDFDRDGFWDWPSDWPRMDAVMPRFSSHLDRLDRNWRSDPFWRDLYPRWAEPIFKEGIDIRTNITNNASRFAVEIDAYQFRPEEIQVKTIDDTLLIEGRHEDVRDRDNFTKMYFVRKYQLPLDVNPSDISSTIDSTGRLMVEARKQPQIQGRERVIPIEGSSRRAGDIHMPRSDNTRSREDSGSYASRMHQQSIPNHRSHSSYSYQHSRTTTGGSPSGTYREHSIPITETGMSSTGISSTGKSSRISERRANEEFHSRERREHEEYRSESKNDYRSQSSRQDSGFQDSASLPNKQDGTRNDDTSSNGVRNIPILRKTFK